MRVLFISRKYPPSVGGMERYSYHLARGLKRYVDVLPMTWGRRQIGLPIFVSWVLLEVLKQWLSGSKFDLIYVGDTVLSPLGWLVGGLYRVPVVSTAYGLDVTFRFPLYQRFVVGCFLQRMSRIVCISKATQRACVARGVSALKTAVIHPGVEVPDDLPAVEEARAWLERRINRTLSHALVLLTVGRLVPRKGVAWFVEHVMPALSKTDNVVYIVVGQGPQASLLHSLVVERRLQDTVYFLGRVSEVDLRRIYAAADLFVMPNVRRKHDMEGFGLVALEAAAHGVPVLAADLEGIRDAVIPGQSGRLLPPGRADVWIEELKRVAQVRDDLARWGQEARESVRYSYSWDAMVRAYVKVFSELVTGL